MKAIVPQRPKPPKSFERLPEYEKQAIYEFIEEEAQRRVNQEQAQLQKIWLQLCCIVLNRAFRFGKKRLLLFLANWREMYRINSKINSAAEQREYLAGEMDRIFGKGGYPTEYIDKLENVG